LDNEDGREQILQMRFDVLQTLTTAVVRINGLTDAENIEAEVNEAKKN
jgi:hypothetical protein